MTHIWYRSGMALLLLTSAAMLLAGLCGCASDPDGGDESFERLLPDETVNSKIFNREIYYAVLLPENYPVTSDSFPVVYLLHGFGDEYTAWYKYGLIQYYADLYASQTGPMIFVMPQGFNTYYVNRHNGNLPYMDFFVNELVPEIDSVYRTRKAGTQRAVMGYSMGGYGALILPVKHPGLFCTSVPLSMSFRTDDQYLAEPQDVFNSQWGITFGGYGASGEERLTDFFKEYSPFHFFDQDDLSAYSGLRFFIDCGDDEETLSVTNGVLHNLMQDCGIHHEFRIRNGGHSWDYWHQSLHEALRFISRGFEGLPFPEEPEPVDIGNLIPAERYILESIDGMSSQIGIFKPVKYDSDTNLYPVIFLIHDFEGSSRTERALQWLSLLNTSMNSGKIPRSLVVEIPADPDEITNEGVTDIIAYVRMHYRLVADKKGMVFLGNEKGGGLVCSLAANFKEVFNACFLFNASLATDVQGVAGLYYYIDLVDQSQNYQGNFHLYLDLREKGIKHELRVRQGLTTIQSVFNGLDGSTGYLSQQLRGK